MRKLTIVLSMLMLAAAAAAQGVVGLIPTPLAWWQWNPTTDQWQQVPSTYNLFPSANTPQAVAFYGWNASLGQWTPCTTDGSCPMGSGATIIEVNGTPASPASPVSFDDTPTITWAIVGNQIKATAVGGCGAVLGDNSSTNCGYNNRAGDTAAVPASVETFGSGLLGNNSAMNLIAAGYDIGSYTSGSAAILMGSSSAEGSSSLPCALSETYLFGDFNLQNCAGGASGPNAGVIGLGSYNFILPNPNTIEFGNALGEGYSNFIFNSNVSNAVMTSAVGLGQLNIQQIGGSSYDLVGVGDENIVGDVGGHVTGISDIAALGDVNCDLSANSNNVLCAGDASGELPSSTIATAPPVTYSIFLGTNSGAVSGNDNIGAGDNSLAYQLGAQAAVNDNIAIGNHSLACLTTGIEDIDIGDYNDSNGFVNSGNCGNSNTSGSHHVLIGENLGSSSTTQLNYIYGIGRALSFTQSGETMLGDPANTTLFVAYGAPQFPYIKSSSGENCLQIDAFGNMTNTGGACGAGSAITALTGDVTATGPGSAAATLATVNSSPGSCGDSTHTCAVTVNGKGLTTAQTATAIASSTVNGQSVAPGGTANGNYVSGSFTVDDAITAASTAGQIKDAGFKPAAAPGNQTDEASSFAAACTGAAYNAPSTNAGAITLTGPGSCPAGGSFSMMNHSSFAVTLTAGAVGFGVGSPSSLAANQSTSCVYNGTVLNCSVPSSGTASPLTTKGDLYGFSTVNARLPVGPDGDQLYSDSTQPLGVKWGAASAGANYQNAVYVSPNCGTAANCYTVFDDGNIAQDATYPVVSGGATMTATTSNSNVVGVESGHVTSGSQAFTMAYSTNVPTNVMVALLKETSAGSGTMGTCWGTNDTGGTSATTITVSVTPTGGSGHGLIALANNGVSTSSTVTFSDNSGTNTWSPVLASVLQPTIFPSFTSATAHTPASQGGFSQNPISGTYTVTATFGTSGPDRSIAVCEVSGLASSSALDAKGGNEELGSPSSVMATATTNDFSVVMERVASTTGTFTAGSNGSTLGLTTGSTDPAFVSGDVGKLLVGASQCETGNGLNSCVQSMPSGESIATYVGAHSITLSLAPSAASSVLHVNQTGGLAWGHDDATQIAAAWAQALTLPNSTVWLPCGTMLIGAPPFLSSSTGNTYNVNLTGCVTGTQGTVLVPTPAFNYGAASGAIIYNYTGCSLGGPTANQQNSFLWCEVSNLTVTGMGVDGSSVSTALPVFNANLTKFYNVFVNGWNWNNTAGANAEPAFKGTGLVLYDSGAWGGADSTLYINGNDVSSIIPSLCVDCWFGAQVGAGGPTAQSPSNGLVLNNAGSSGIGAQLTIVNSTFNPSLAGSTSQTSVGVNVIAGQLHSGSGNQIGGLYVASAGTVWLDGSFTRILDSYGITNAGGTIYAHGTQIDKITQASGHFYDLGGNVACSLTGSQENVCAPSGTEDPWYSHVALTAVTGGTFRGQGMADFTFSAAGTPLPTCSAIYLDATAIVSDATSPTYLGTYTSGGAVHAHVRCDGTNWVTE